ncbi:ABC transporter [Colletotrichum kahawae]|uniref:ABC transporter n=1 Tax=Colletotrichum kahawae TaxID=34407 RepID=A0AAD9YEN4_COLKA|nr:ABC transporter [Colletotrichum kahawae]
MSPDEILDYTRLSGSILAALTSLTAPWISERRVSPLRGFIWVYRLQMISVWSNALYAWTLSTIRRDPNLIPTWCAVCFATATTFQISSLYDDSDRLCTLYKWAWCLGSLNEAIVIVQAMTTQDSNGWQVLRLSIAISTLLLYVFLLSCVFVGQMSGYRRLPQDEDAASETDETHLVVVHKPETDMNWTDRLRIFWRFMWPRKSLGIQICLVLTLLLNLGRKGVNVWVLQALGRIIDGLTYGGTWLSIKKRLLAWIVPQACDVVFLVLQSWLSLIVRAYRGKKLDKAVYAKIMTADPSYHSIKSSTSLTTAVDRAKGVDGSFDSLMEHSFDFLFATCVTIPITALMFGQHVMIIMTIRLVVAYLNFRRGIAKSQKANADYIEVDKAHKLSREDTMRGWETAAVFGQIAHQIAENNKSVGKVHAAKFQSYLQRVITWAFGLASGEVGFAVSAWLVCSQIFVGPSTPGSFAVYITYWTQIVTPITSILKSFDEIIDTFQKAAEVAEIMDTIPKERGKRLRFEQGAIKFQNVTLSRGGIVVLDNFNLDIDPKEEVALVGPSGAGKLTILGLLTGHIEPDSGKVLVDGQDVTKIDFDSLSNFMGILQQNPHIYNTTVKENLLIGKRNATMVEIQEACVKARIHDAIERRQGGYENPCGVDGK